MKVMNAKEIGGDPIRNEISSIFVDGFYKWIKFFSKDKEALKKAFAHIMLRSLMTRWRDLPPSIMTRSKIFRWTESSFRSILDSLWGLLLIRY